MRNLSKIVGVVPILLMLACATDKPGPDVAEVSGQAFYLERMAAPPGARLEVVLEDISRQDAAAEQLGEFTLANAGQPPYDFTIEYDPAQIDPRYTYRVAARLFDGEGLLFASDQVHQVITRGFPDTANVRMRRIKRAPSQPLEDFPAAFAGTLPCASCPGIDTQLHLLDDSVYVLRQEYQGHEDAVFNDIGRYLISSDGAQISLHGGREAPLRFAIQGPDALRMLDRDGQHIVSELNYTLVRRRDLTLPETSLLLGGKYRYLAGAGRFQECLTGLDMPVATEEDNLALEEAYLEAREEPGEALKVSMEGRIEQRMPVEGPGPVLTVVPERFIGVWPDQDCPDPISRATLHNSYWRVEWLLDDAVRKFPDQREPHLNFRESGELAGSDGCNRLSGRFQLGDEGEMAFSQIAATSRMCADGMDQAKAFRDALAIAAHIRIIGQHLEILDAEGGLLMRLQAVALS